MGKARIEYLKVENLTVDADVQRTINHARVGKLADEFDPEGLGVITVSRRDDGVDAIVDGQHRWEAAKKVGWKTLQAQVYTELSKQDEAALFRVRNNTRIVNTFDRFRVRVVEGDVAAIDMDRALRLAGWLPNVTRKSAGNAFSAVGALEWVYRGADIAPAPLKGEHGYTEVIQTVLNTITASWAYDPDGVRADVVRGLGAFFMRHGTTTLDNQKLVKELSHYPGGPMNFVSQARMLKTVRTVSMADAVADVLTGLYNKKRTVNRIPEWLAGRKISNQND